MFQTEIRVVADVRTTDSSPAGSQSVLSVDQPSSRSSMITLHIGAPVEGLCCGSISLLMHAFASLAVNRGGLASKITSTGVRPDSLISAPCWVICSAPRMDLAYRLRSGWRSSRLPTSLGSHLSSLQYSATAWTHATWSVLTVTGTSQYFLVRIRSLASTALAFFMHWLCCSLNVR